MTRLIHGFGLGLLAVPFGAAFCDTVGYVAKVEGSSMQPRLNADPSDHSDFVFLDRLVALNKHRIKRGDVIAVTSPRDESQTLIKRVIGLQGDSIKTLKGDKLVRIPPGHIWVEGDNHEHSYDSNHFGPITMKHALARATHIVWPPKRWSAIESSVPEERTPVRGNRSQQCFDGMAEMPVTQDVGSPVELS